MAKQNVTITLKMSELMYDIENKTHLTARSRQTGDNYRDVAHMQVSDNENETDQVLTSIGHAWSLLLSKLHEYVVDRESDGVNELPSVNDDLSVVLALPMNFNLTAVETLTRALHGYVVHKSIADWLEMTDKADAADHLQQALTMMQQVFESINRRKRPVREDLL